MKSGKLGRNTKDWIRMKHSESGLNMLSPF